MKSLKSFLWHQLREGSVGFEVLGTVFCVEDALLIWHYSLTTKAKACTSCVQQPLLSTDGLHILQDALPAPVPLCLLLALLSLSLYLSQNDVILSVYLWTFILCSPSLVCAKALQSCPTLGDPMDCSPLALLSMGFSRQQYWSRLPFPSPLYLFAFGQLHEG